RIKALLDERTPIYEEVATHTVDTDGRTPEDVAHEIRELLEGRPRSSAQFARPHTGDPDD
ncbi:MAG TPA: hypothetical protein VFY58_10710, partial [Nocardioides sp.]|nr:hypothetical protein [Nocardioides sp.]